MVEYNKINAKVSDSQLNKLKSTVKNKQGTTLRRKIAGPLMKVAVPLAKKYFSFTRNNYCCFSNRCRSSKENA